MHYGARWYNPITGTWTQQDTLDAPLDPANANRYAYAGDDPINGNDPLGLSSYPNCFYQAGEILLATGGFIVGVLTGPVGLFFGAGSFFYTVNDQPKSADGLYFLCDRSSY